MSPLEIMRERRAAKAMELDELLAGPTEEKRDLNTDEDAKFSNLVDEIRKADDRIAELEAQEVRTKASDEARRLAGDGGVQTGSAKVIDPPVYAKDKYDTSYFRDLYMGTKANDSEAIDRLRRNSAMVKETRALGNTGGVGGSGGKVIFAAA